MPGKEQEYLWESILKIRSDSMAGTYTIAFAIHFLNLLSIVACMY